MSTKHNLGRAFDKYSKLETRPEGLPAVVVMADTLPAGGKQCRTAELYLYEKFCRKAGEDGELCFYSKAMNKDALRHHYKDKHCIILGVRKDGRVIMDAGGRPGYEKQAAAAAWYKSLEHVFDAAAQDIAAYNAQLVAPKEPVSSPAKKKQERALERQAAASATVAKKAKKAAAEAAHAEGIEFEWRQEGKACKRVISYMEREVEERWKLRKDFKGPLLNDARKAFRKLANENDDEDLGELVDGGKRCSGCKQAGLAHCNYDDDAVCCMAACFGVLKDAILTVNMVGAVLYYKPNEVWDYNKVPQEIKRSKRNLKKYVNARCQHHAVDEMYPESEDGTGDNEEDGDADAGDA